MPAHSSGAAKIVEDLKAALEQLREIDAGLQQGEFV